MGDNFLFQVLSELTRKNGPTRLAICEQGRTCRRCGCLGHSDHEIVEFKVFSVVRKQDSRVATLDFESEI